MQHTTLFRKRLAFVLAALSFAAVVLLVAAPSVSAREGQDDSVLQTTAQEPANEQDQEQETERSGHESGTQRVKSRLVELRQEAKKELEQKKEGRKELAEEKRKQVCENRQNAIENKLAAFNQAAQKHYDKLVTVQKRIVGYATAEGLSPQGFASLTAAAEAKKSAAETAMLALKTLAVNVDCSDPETVVKLSEVREAAKTTRTALHDYRKALKDMVVALAQAKHTTDDTDGSTPRGTSGDSSASTTSATDGGNQ